MSDEILTYIKEHIESAFNLITGAFGMCCGNITVLQCSNAAGLIANVGGAILVLVQIYRMMRKNVKRKPSNDA